MCRSFRSIVAVSYPPELNVISVPSVQRVGVRAVGVEHQGREVAWRVGVGAAAAAEAAREPEAVATAAQVEDHAARWPG